MKKLICIAALLASCGAVAGSEIESSTGATCQQSDFQPFELSLEANSGDNRTEYTDSRYNEDESYVGVELTYSFGGAKQIDCSRFQGLVEREQEAHVTQLELKVKQLEAQLQKQAAVNRIKFK